MARPGKAGMAGQRAVRIVWERTGKAWQAGQGGAMSGRAWHGKAGRDRLGTVGHGLVGHGRRGGDRRGMAS